MGAIQDILDQFGDQTVQIIQHNLKETNTDASGETSRSVRSEPSKNRSKVTGKDFIYVAETGRRPGKQPPVSKIQGWIETGKPRIEKDIESAAWAISKTIAKEGSALWKRGGREDIITPAISDQRIDQLTSDIADALLNETVEVIEDGITSSNRLALRS